MLSALLNGVDAGEADASSLAVLRRTDATLAEVQGALTALDRSVTPRLTLALGIVANITVDLLAVCLRRHAYMAGVRLQVRKGSYDDLLGDVQAHREAGVDLLLILPFFDNLQPGWESQVGHLGEAERHAVHRDYLSRLELALAASRNGSHPIGQVLLMGAHAWQPAGAAQRQALEEFNGGLAAAAAKHSHVRLLPLADLVVRCGAAQAFDARFYFRAKAPYTARFADNLAREVALATRGFGTAFYKVLVLDCDNTLWGGIVGEDGPTGIKLDPYSHPGNIFWTVQQQCKALEAQGVLLCLCSKNNAADVDEVMQHHPSMVLRESQLLARQVNWTDKPANLRALAAQLNLGLESFVFVDDSAFEVQAVREQLPQVTVFQVPAALHTYPALFAEQIAPLFTAGGVSAESRSKTQQYRHLAEATQAQTAFASHADYLQSLGLVVTLQRDATAHVPRIAELILKSNQFNLTTQRLQTGDVLGLMQATDATVYSFSVSDRLADHGLTGVLITIDDEDAVVVHSFLMSCRVIGRGVEFAIWRAVIADALARGKRLLRTAYVPTAKNAQVADFYDRLGLSAVDAASGASGDGSRHYAAELATVQLAASAWVELRNA